MHPSDGTLRRSLDEPFAIEASARRHLATCSRCAERLTRIGGDAAQVSTLMAASSPVIDIDAARSRLAAAEAATAPAAPPARARPATLRQRRSPATRVFVGIAIAAAASTVLVVSGGAQDFLSLFQPTQFAAVPVSNTDIRTLAGLTSYGSVNGATTPLNVTHEPDAASAGRAAGLAVPEIVPPSGTTATPTYSVIGGTMVSFTFSAALAQAAAARAGAHLPPLPAGLDGSTLTVTIAPAVVIAYGLDPAAIYNGGGSLPTDGSAFVVVASRTPTVSSTGVTVETMENYLLSVPGLPAGVVSEIRAIGDPAQTVPVPIPIDLANASAADINGSHGLLIGDSTGLGTIVLWQHNHVVYAVAGTISSDTALGIARSAH